MSLTPSRKERQELAARIRIAREESGLTQSQLGDLLGKQQTFVSKLELGERSISLLEAKKLSDVLGIKVTSLLGNDLLEKPNNE